MEVLKEIKALEMESNKLVIEAEKEKARKIEEAKALAVDLVKKAVEEAEKQGFEMIKAARERGKSRAGEIEKASKRKGKVLTERVSREKTPMKQKILRRLLRVQA